MQALKTKLSSFWFFLFISVLVRVWNFPNSLYFIWDQGRDAWVLSQIAQGDFTLLGPTSGLPGFWLGPLWYYLGVPGYWLSQGNPYGIGLWYILLACTALPLFWKLAHTLFKDKSTALLTAWFLSLAPGSIQTSIFIWNPLISLPLMSGALLALLKGRNSRHMLALGFFLLALTLQAEFAYAVFLIAPLFFLIPWIRQKKDWRDFAAATAAIGITLIPQALFELRNQFIMTKSLWASLGDPERTVSFLWLWLHRPLHLFGATEVLFFQHLRPSWPYTIGVLPLLFWVVRKIWHKKADFQWKLIAFLAVIPYIFAMFWRGNYGNYFAYYMAPHFIFLIPLVVLGLSWLKEKKRGVWLIFVGVFLVGSINFIGNSTLVLENTSGLRTMNTAIARVYELRGIDEADQGAVRIFTPNGQTEHYDYLLHWQAKEKNVSVPHTFSTPEDHTWYILMEPDPAPLDRRFLPWYKPIVAGGVLVRREKFGSLTLETWMKHERAAERGLPFTIPVLDKPGLPLQ